MTDEGSGSQRGGRLTQSHSTSATSPRHSPLHPTSVHAVPQQTLGGIHGEPNQVSGCADCKKKQTLKWGRHGLAPFHAGQTHLHGHCVQFFALPFSGDWINGMFWFKKWSLGDLSLSKWLKRPLWGRSDGFLCGASKGRIEANGVATTWRESLVQHNEELSNNQSQLTMEEKCLGDWQVQAERDWVC